MVLKLRISHIRNLADSRGHAVAYRTSNYPECGRRDPNKIETPPGKIFEDLVSGDAVRRRNGYERLGIAGELRKMPLDDAHRIVANLDDDVAPEEIIVCSVGRRLTVAVVFDQDHSDWWQAV